MLPLRVTERDSDTDALCLFEMERLLLREARLVTETVSESVMEREAICVPEKLCVKDFVGEPLCVDVGDGEMLELTDNCCEVESVLEMEPVRPS